MNRELARKIADAVLYEGYMLYPYRPSAIKNQQRWSFGILYPPDYGEVASGTERSLMHSECIVESSAEGSVPALEVQLRFLHLIARRVAQSQTSLNHTNRISPVQSLEVDGRKIESWDEGVERSVEFRADSLADPQPPHRFRFLASSQHELLRDGCGRLAGVLTRTQQEISGSIAIHAEQVAARVWKIAVEITNITPHDGTGNRDAALFRSLLSAHTILTVRNGAFVSLLDPPDELKDAVKGCHNVGNFPVLVGSSPEREMMLCSPIVLYDYPQVAPESATDFYDSTEIDELLTLRIMTLTAEEKDAMRLADERVRNLLERTEQNAREQLARTHGALRGATSGEIRGVTLNMRSTGNKP